MAEQESDTDVAQFMELAFANQSLEALMATMNPKDDAQFAEALQQIANRAYQEAYDVLQANPAQNQANPNRALALALTQKQLELTDEATLTLETLIATPDIDSRTQLWAWLALRTLGKPLDSTVIYRVLGVVIQVHNPEQNRVDLLAAYLDGRVRHVTTDGQILVWDRAKGDIADLARGVVHAAQAMARDFPSEQQRGPLKENTVRISLLTVGGIRVLEENASRINTSIMFPVFDSGTELLNRLLAIYNAA